MSYVNHASDPRRRSAAVISAIAINAAVGYVLVTGLATDFVAKVEKELEASFIIDPPEPTPTPEPVVQPQPTEAQPLVAPKPVLEIPSTPRIDVIEFDPLVTSDPVIVPVPSPSPLIQPTPQPSFAPKAAP